LADHADHAAMAIFQVFVRFWAALKIWKNGLKGGGWVNDFQIVDTARPQEKGCC
jgi:hypothetical protein